MASPPLAELTVPIRGDLSPLERDLAAAKKRLEDFNRSMGGGSGSSGAINQMNRTLQAANDNARQMAQSLQTATASAQQLNTSVTNIGGAATRAAVAVETNSGAVERNTAVIQRNAVASRFAANQQKILAYQLVDVTQMLAMGQAPLMTLIQQGPQIAQIYGPGEGGLGRAFRESAGMIGGLIGKFPILSAAMVVTAGASFEVMRGLREAGNEAVTFGDVMSGLFATIGEYVGSFLSPLFPYVSAAWDWLTSSTKAVGNEIIKSFQIVYNDLVFLFKAFPEVIALSVSGAANIVVSGIEKMINYGVVGINKLIAAVNALPDWMKPESLENIDPMSSVRLGRVSSGGASLEDNFADRLARQNEILASDPLGEFMDAWRRNTLEATHARDDKKVGRTKGDPYKDLIRDGQQFIEQQRLEAQQLGMTSEAAASLRYEQELLHKAQDANIKLSPQQREELKELAAQMAAAEEQTRRLTEAYEFGKETFTGFFSDIKSELQNGASVWEAFGEAAANALDRIADRALQMAAEGIWDMIFGAFSGGGSGGSGGNWFTNFLGGLFPGHANGTSFSSGGWRWVGERGPELMKVPSGSQVIANNRLSVPSTPSFGGASNGGGVAAVDIFVRDDGKLAAIARNSGREGAKDYVDVRIREYDQLELPQSVERIREHPRMRG